MTVGSSGAAAAAAAAAQRAAAEAARRRAEEAARARAAAAAAAKAKTAQAAAAKQAAAAQRKQPPLHPKERPTKNRSAFADSRPVPKAGKAAAPIRERATKNRSAFGTTPAFLNDKFGKAEAKVAAAEKAHLADDHAHLSAASKRDAKAVQSTYDDALKANKGNEAQAANAAAQKLRGFTEEHSGDEQYARALVVKAGPTIDKIASTLGKHVDTGAYGDKDSDKDAITDSVRALSDVAGSAGPLGAALMGKQLANKIPDKSELRKVDDAFYTHLDKGGSALLFASTTKALEAQGKDSAAGELKDRHDGIISDAWDAVSSLPKGVWNAATDLGGAVGDAAGDVVHLAVDGAKVAVNVADNTVDFVGDVAGDTAHAAESAAKFAAEQGLKLAGKALGAVHQFALDKIDGALQISKSVGSLKQGDTYTLGGKVDVAAGIEAGVEGQIQVSRDKGGYTVSAELAGKLGLGAGAHASAGLGGKAEMTYQTADEAAKAARVLAAAAASTASPVLAPALAPHPDELGSLKQHLSSVEVTGSVEAGVDAQLGGAGLEGGAAGSAKVSTGYKVEFANGKPVALVRETTLEGEGGVSAASELFKGKGKNPVTAALAAGGTADGALTVETRIKLNQAKVGDVAAYLASPTSAAFAGAAQTSVRGNVEVDGGARGAQGEIEVSGISGQEARQVVGRLVQGRGDAFKGVKVDVAGSASSFSDRGLNVELDLKVGGLGIDAAAQAEVRHVHELAQFGG